ncbi:uncharacterized protein TRIADDRAFT_28401, partial [Trichoplax adhaerens]
KVLVYGGKGALGSALVTFFRSKQWWVASADIFENPDANANVLLSVNDSWVEQEQKVLSNLSDLLQDGKFSAVLCVAGGWAGGNAASDDLVKNSDLMWKQSVWTSVIAAKIAAKYLEEGGLLTLTGAQPALGGTPGMIGYGLAKAAVHQLVKSLASTNSGLPANARAVGILPVTLDTPMNRKFMASADFSTWTPLTFVAELFHAWISNEKPVDNGSLIQLVTKDNETECVPVA